jgi:hypothetical protein
MTFPRTTTIPQTTAIPRTMAIPHITAIPRHFRPNLPNLTRGPSGLGTSPNTRGGLSGPGLPGGPTKLVSFGEKSFGGKLFSKKSFGETSLVTFLGKSHSGKKLFGEWAFGELALYRHDPCRSLEEQKNKYILVVR